MTDARPDFVPYDRPSPLLTAIGGFLRHRDDPLRARFLVEGPKTNARGLLHGGVIASVGDVVIGHALAVRTDPPTPLITVNLSCDMVGTAREGDWVDIAVVPTRTGRRLAAGTATFAAGGRVIANVSALFMPSRPAAAAGRR
ncbi:PaaI family thioesterase [Spirillospora sp. NPDC046719]